MNELIELYRKLTPDARREFNFAMTVINAAIVSAPCNRLDEYDARHATGVVDTTGFTAADFDRLSQIERKYGRA